MANPLYWEDALSSTSGAQTEMIVDTHAPSFRVNWGTGKYDDVEADHSSLIGTRPIGYDAMGTCRVCMRSRWLAHAALGVCAPCQRAQQQDELSRIYADSPMGSHKRTTHITTDTKT